MDGTADGRKTTNLKTIESRVINLTTHSLTSGIAGGGGNRPAASRSEVIAAVVLE